MRAWFALTRKRPALSNRSETRQRGQEAASGGASSGSTRQSARSDTASFPAGTRDRSERQHGAYAAHRRSELRRAAGPRPVRAPRRGRAAGTPVPEIDEDWGRDPARTKESCETLACTEG